MSTIMQHKVSCNATLDFVTFFATLNSKELQMKQLGAWIKRHREMMNFSQETAAEKVGLSRYQWIRIENGKSGTKRETILTIAKELNADATEALTLLAGLEVEPKKPYPQQLEEMMKNVSYKLDEGYTEADKDGLFREMEFAFDVALKRLEERKKKSQ